MGNTGRSSNVIDLGWHAPQGVVNHRVKEEGGDKERVQLDWVQSELYSLSTTDTNSGALRSNLLPERFSPLGAKAAVGVTQTPWGCIGDVLQAG
jgi:hypothetical protein